MLVCVKCRVELRIAENSLGARFGESHAYAGDKYKCPKCESEIILTNREAVHDPQKKIKTIQMDES